MKVYTELEIAKYGLTVGALQQIFNKYTQTTTVEQVHTNDEVIWLSLARYVGE